MYMGASRTQAQTIRDEHAHRGTVRIHGDDLRRLSTRRPGRRSGNDQGTIRDSLSGGVLAGATVQLVPSAAPWSAGWTVTNDPHRFHRLAIVSVVSATAGAP